jgi:hypothetical protein
MKTRFAVLASSIASLMGVSGIATAAERDRACLNGIVENYIAAMAAPEILGDVTRNPFTTTVLPDKRRPRAELSAIVNSVPYGMRPAFSTGTHMPSPQAQQAGFREY